MPKIVAKPQMKEFAPFVIRTFILFVHAPQSLKETERQTKSPILDFFNISKLFVLFHHKDILLDNVAGTTVRVTDVYT